MTTKLSYAEEAVVQKALELGPVSQSAIARALQKTPATVNQHLKKPSVQSALVVRAAEQRDKARGLIGRSHRMIQKASRLLDQLVDQDGSQLSAAELAGIMKMGLDFIEKVEALGLIDSPDSEALHRLQEKVQQAIDVGRYLERRKMRVPTAESEVIEGGGSLPGLTPAVDTDH
jgi:IS30 family transposase